MLLVALPFALLADYTVLVMTALLCLVTSGEVHQVFDCGILRGQELLTGKQMLRMLMADTLLEVLILVQRVIEEQTT